MPQQTQPTPQWTPTVVPAPGAGAMGMSRVDRSFSARLSRAWTFCKMAMRLMREQPGLIAVPCIAALVMLAVLISAALIADASPGALGDIFMIVAIFACAIIGMLGQAVISQRVWASLDGSTISNAQALRQVNPRFPTLAVWAILALSVGVAIRSLERSRLSFLVRIVGYALDVAWSAATFFVLPVILFEQVTVSGALRRSREIVRSTWGEAVMGVGILAILFNLISLAVIGLCVLLVAVHAWVIAIFLLFSWIIGINVLVAVTMPIYTVALYRYATCQELAFGLQANDLAAAFRPSRKSMAFAA